MYSKIYFYVTATVGTAALLLSLPTIAEIKHTNTNASQEVIFVSDDSWQPEGFVTGTPVPAAWSPTPEIVIDGVADEAVWLQAEEVEVPLSFGTVKQAWVKALYSNEDVFISVRWPDATEDRLHRPWTWDVNEKRFKEGPQIEDSMFLSFEAGCEWDPSLLGGYSYDFDAWHWLAARSDPLGQALDLYGNVRTRDNKLPGFGAYKSRVTKSDWILKFIENQDVDLNADWNELDRIYMKSSITDDLWVRAVPDGGKDAPPFVEQLPAPSSEPTDFDKMYPQFNPVKLDGEAAEVAAKGRWKDGYWTVEFQRARETPVGHIYDTIFNRLVQFSVNVFDHTERLDQASESSRLFLQFLDKDSEPEVAQSAEPETE